MKKLGLICTVIACFAMAACQKGGFLETKSTASLTKDITFADSANTMNYLGGLYSDIAFNFPLSNNNADYSKMCDEGEGKFPVLGNYDKVITQGTFATGLRDITANQWTLFYKNIHNENIYLAEVDKSPLSAALKQRTKAEARFIRVLMYSFLTKWFGGVPLIGDKVYALDDVPTENRNTYEECVNYMTKELDAIANALPTDYTGLDYGHVTKGACLALKSRILLFAASPLFNGGSTSTNPGVIPLTAYPSNNPNRWQLAADAAKAVMDLGTYSLFTDNTTKWGGNAAGLGCGFYKVFITRKNDELILFKPLPTGKQIENQFNPKSRGGANYWYYPTQELVDMFPTINGKPIATDIKSGTNPQGYDAANPYANRDPRLSATVIYNGNLYFSNVTKALATVDTYVGGADGILAVSSNAGTTTGYFVRKFCDENGAVTGGSNVDRSLPIIRYAEILLNYAEAINETGNQTEAMNTLKLLRARAGITIGANGMYGLPVSPNKDEARVIIQNERAIELAYEQHRFWDLRRWKLGSLLDGKYVHGMQITRVGTTTPAVFTYKKIEVRTRYFKEIYYYWPIPKDDATINQSLLQNPGY